MSLNRLTFVLLGFWAIMTIKLYVALLDVDPTLIAFDSVRSDFEDRIPGDIEEQVKCSPG